MERPLGELRIEVVDEAVAEILRRKTPAERMAMVGAAWRSARHWVRACVASQHPEWDSDQVTAEVNRRFLSGTG